MSFVTPLHISSAVPAPLYVAPLASIRTAPPQSARAKGERRSSTRTGHRLRATSPEGQVLSVRVCHLPNFIRSSHALPTSTPLDALPNPSARLRFRRESMAEWEIKKCTRKMGKVVDRSQPECAACGGDRTRASLSLRCAMDVLGSRIDMSTQVDGWRLSGRGRLILFFLRDQFNCCSLCVQLSVCRSASQQAVGVSERSASEPE